MALTLLVTTFVAACTTTAPGNFCDVSRSFTHVMTDNDVEVISDGLATELAGHEKYGARACGW